jgi:oligopeptidase B
MPAARDPRTQLHDTSAQVAKLSPPVAKWVPTVIEAHGDKRVDGWAWLRDSSNPEVLEHLLAENAYCEAALAHLSGLREVLFREIKSRIDETDVSAPALKGSWWYYQRVEEGSDYAVHCRVPAGTPGDVPVPPAEPRPGPAFPDEQVLLDENLLAEGQTYFDIGSLAISPDHRLLAYGADTSGDERFVLRIRDLSSGEDLAESIEGTSYGLAWSAGSDVLFYTRADAANRPHQVWRHRIGTDPRGPQGDALVLEEPDERFHLGVGNTKDGSLVTVEAHSKVTSEVLLIDARRPEEAPRVVEPRRQDVEYSVEHYHGNLLVLTNDSAPNFRLMACPLDSPGRDHWRELVPEREEVRLEGIEVVDGALACFERLEGCPRIRVHSLLEGGHTAGEGGHTAGEGGQSAGSSLAGPLGDGYLLPAGETPSTFYGGANLDMSSPWLRYEYSSLVTPRVVADLPLAQLGGEIPSAGIEVHVRKRQVVKGGYDPSAYISERLWARAQDGTRVPISTVRRRDIALDGSAPCLLYGYGAYEISIDPVFSSIRLSLLDRGFVFAIAHVRGGGELGRKWYEDGKLLAKPHTFSDFVAVARHLVDQGHTSPDRLVARGGSAGGLLMGSVANLAPELFRAIVAEVPFVDCLTTMLDPTLPLTVIEWEEWGNPAADADVYSVMKSYAPYDNVRPVRYPDMLVTAGLTDPRVGYFEPAKWVQRLRAANPANKALLHVEMDAGHAGPSGRYDAWREEARVLAFVLDAVGLATSPGPASS